MTPAVADAIEELKSAAPGSGVRVKEDGDGGAFVIVDGVEIGEAFEPAITWLGFHITWVHPDADIYPYFIDPTIRYLGGGAAPNAYPAGNLPAAISRGATMPGFEISAIQVSRRSNRRKAETDTALTKLLRIIDFLRSR